MGTMAKAKPARRVTEDRTDLIPVERVARSILLIRGQKVLLDVDLAALYGVETRVLVQAIKRNLARFPMTSCFSSRPRNSCA